MVKLSSAIDQLRTAHDGMCKMFGIEPSQQPSRHTETWADVYAHLSIALGIVNSILGEIGCRELCVARESLYAARKALFPRPRPRCLNRLSQCHRTFRHRSFSHRYAPHPCIFFPAVSAGRVSQ